MYFSARADEGLCSSETGNGGMEGESDGGRERTEERTERQITDIFLDRQRDEKLQCT